MRQVGITDLYHAARAVQAVPSTNREQFCRELLWRAHVADKYVKRLRKLHAEWGDGSLRAAALAQCSIAQKGIDASDFRRCLLIVLTTFHEGYHQSSSSSGLHLVRQGLHM